MGENLQDMMLCGGSDSAIIPIGIKQLKLLNIYPFFMNYNLKISIKLQDSEGLLLAMLLQNEIVIQRRRHALGMWYDFNVSFFFE